MHAVAILRHVLCDNDYHNHTADAYSNIAS